MATNFPSKGDDEKVTLRNSKRPQFDYAFAKALKADFPTIWKAGGNVRGNEAFNLWVKARAGDYTDAVTAWVKEREAWAARHAGDGSQFPEDEPNLSNIAGVVAAIKWGVILDIGEGAMKRAVNAVKAKQKGERHLVAIVDEGDHYVLKFAKADDEPSPFEVTDQDNPLTNEPEGVTDGGGSGGGGNTPTDTTLTSPTKNPSKTTDPSKTKTPPADRDPYEEEREVTKSQDMDKSIERRFIGTTTLELREAGPEGRRAEGYAAVFNSPTTIQTLRGSFREVLTREAFEGRLEDNVLALFNHDQASPLAKVGAGLELSLDDHGLRYSFPIPDTTTGRDLIELMDRGIVKDASFAFTVGEDGQRWERDEEADIDVRTITKLNRLVDVSVVTIGAYPDASSSLRSFEGSNFNELHAEGATPHSAQDMPAKEPETAPEQTLSLGGLRSAIIRAKRSNF